MGLRQTALISSSMTLCSFQKVVARYDIFDSSLADKMYVYDLTIIQIPYRDLTIIQIPYNDLTIIPITEFYFVMFML